MHRFVKQLVLAIVMVPLVMSALVAHVEAGVGPGVIDVAQNADPVAAGSPSGADSVLFLPFSEVIGREVAAVASPLGASCCSGDYVCDAPFQACLALCPPTFPENFSCIGTCRQEYVACTIAACGG